MTETSQDISFKVRPFRAIRVRLFVAFVLVGVLPMVAVSIIAIVFSVRSGRSRAINTLESAGNVRAMQIDAWVDGLQSSLDEIFVQKQVSIYAQLIFNSALETGAAQGVIEDLAFKLGPYLGPGQPFAEFFLIDDEGRVVFSTGDIDRGRLYRNAEFFRSGLSANSVRLLGDGDIVVVQPVQNEQQETSGIFCGRVSIDVLQAMMDVRTFLDENTKNYLIDSDYVIVAGTGIDRPQMIARTPGAIEALKGASGSALYANHVGVPVIGAYQWLPKIQLVLLVEVPQVVAFKAMYMMLAATGVTALLMTTSAVWASFAMTRQISVPIVNLAQVARRIAAGERDLVATVEREDEIGALARAFNSMTAQLRELVGSLERRVGERTRALEQQTVYLQATADVGRTLSSILDVDQLIRQVAQVIQDRFGLYYVGLFQVDESGEWAVLRAGSGEYGRRMVARGHRIRVGEGMVGWCIANDQIRVASDVSQDQVRLVADELPDTQSEAALPMRAHGHVVGAITVQSDQPDAFDQNALVALQTMADQVASALDNARLFAQVQEALASAERAYSGMSRQAWLELLRGGGMAFRSDARGVTKLPPVSRPEMARAIQEGQTILAPEAQDRDPQGAPLAIPIRIGEEIIGVLDTVKPAADGEWTPQEVAWLQDVTEQLSYALEAARFYQETQSREIRERQIREIGANMQARVSLDALMQTTIADLARVLNVPAAFVQLNTRGLSSQE